MQTELIVKKTITLSAPVSNVWEALTNPELTKKYMSGCEALSDWKVGSPLIWKGLVEGKERVLVKGSIVKVEKGRLLQYTTLDPNSGLEDVPSNYTTVTHELSAEGSGTRLSVSQSDFATIVDGETRYGDSLKGWDHALEGLKKVVESK